MTAPPRDRQYTKSHEWVKADGAELVVGITDHAQAELTDVVFVDLPKAGAAVAAGASVLVLESVKTVADVYAPVAGTIVRANDALKPTPGLVNSAPYEGGWLFRLKPAGPYDPAALLTAEAYEAFVVAGGT